jgi:glycosyltransferase involved in cell wall biosynthesis
MRVLFFVYPSAFQAPGGGEVFLLKTKEALEKKGIAVKFFDQWQDKLADFDLLHIFGSVKECLPLMEEAKHQGLKVALSPIFWSSWQRAIYEYADFPQKACQVMRHLAKVFWPRWPSARRRMLELADILLPNSQAEGCQVSRLFSIPRSKMQVVYLAADKRFAEADKEKFVKNYALRNFVLSTGRIEPRKNQLSLIKAVKGLGLKLVLIGDAVGGQRSYLEECKKQAGQEVIFLPRIGHGDELLASAYAACKVFVLPGWFETPGLAALEAGLAGARLALTAQGSTREYFRNYVEYFNPASPRSMRRAIERALGKERSEDLKNHLLKNFLWENTAEATFAAYQKLLKG